ncbi:MAG: SIMPL domain-containing protein [Thermoleophilia bacterium]|nr:SIMPL domain-containing protein [Thermoleophilia bacterium]
MNHLGRKAAAVAALAALGVGIAAFAGVGRPDEANGQATAGTAPTGITVTGVGSVKAAPDRAEFSFGVESQGETAAAALDANNAAVQRVIDAVRGAGVADADLQTQQVSVYPRYSEDGQTIVGYSAVNTVSAKIRDLATTGAVVDAAAAAGANQVYGPTLSIDDQSGLYQDALEQALEDARTKAKTIAAAAGVTLGAVVNIVEGGGAVPPMYAEQAARDGGGVPIEPGLQEIPASLTVTFAIS